MKKKFFLKVIPDSTALSNFIQLAQKASTQGRGSSAIENILYAGNQNLVCQLVESLSQTLNTMSSNAQQAAILGLKKQFFFSNFSVFLFRYRKCTCTKSLCIRFNIIEFGKELVDSYILIIIFFFVHRIIQQQIHRQMTV